MVIIFVQQQECGLRIVFDYVEYDALYLKFFIIPTV